MGIDLPPGFHEAPGYRDTPPSAKGTYLAPRERESAITLRHWLQGDPTPLPCMSLARRIVDTGPSAVGIWQEHPPASRLQLILDFSLDAGARQPELSFSFLNPSCDTPSVLPCPSFLLIPVGPVLKYFSLNDPKSYHWPLPSVQIGAVRRRASLDWELRAPSLSTEIARRPNIVTIPRAYSYRTKLATHDSKAATAT